MIIGIVGSEAAKFTLLGEQRAKVIINDLINNPSVEEVVSGACHLGGIDIWTAKAAKAHGKIVTEYPPAILNWEGGYKPRNMQIANRSHVVYCITVKTLPPEYVGMRFNSCYHCNVDTHVKSGGCWTMKYARQIGRQGALIIVENE